MANKSRTDEANLTQYLLPETNVSNISLMAQPEEPENLNSVVVPSVCLSHRTPAGKENKANT